MNTEESLSLTAVRTAGVLAGTAAMLVKTHDVLGTVTRLLIAATEATGAAAGGLILRRLGQDGLELLAATSHRAEELELYQIQVEQGPCLEAVETGAATWATSSASIEQRWPAVAKYFVRAGFTSAHATPLIWQGDSIGALNLFWTDEQPKSQSLDQLIQGFADMATLAIVHSSEVPIDLVLLRIRGALSERTVLEQAKGVLAQQHKVGQAEAFSILMETAAAADEPLTLTAAKIVERAATGQR
jgi:hypothetical protein